MVHVVVHYNNTRSSFMRSKGRNGKEGKGYVVLLFKGHAPRYIVF